MGRKRHTAEQIIGKLRTAEIELAKGLGTAEVVRKLGISRKTETLGSSSTQATNVHSARSVTGRRPTSSRERSKRSSCGCAPGYPNRCR
jgi:hypothetical protein